jgi:hypothetical protein
VPRAPAADPVAICRVRLTSRGVVVRRGAAPPGNLMIVVSEGSTAPRAVLAFQIAIREGWERTVTLHS